MPRLNVSLVCLLVLSLCGSALAQTAVDPNSDAGVVSMQDFSGGATLRGTYFDVRNMTGDGVGYRNGYTQIGGFTPFWLNEEAFIATNTRLLITDNSKIGVGSGLVARRYFAEQDRIYGVYGYLDSDETQYGNRYNQTSFGFETLGQWLDFRANGYVTLGSNDRFIRALGVTGDPYYRGNTISFLGSQLREESLTGADFEFGSPLTPATPWLRGYLGMYGYQSSGADPVGVRGRIEANISNDLTVGVNVTEDRQFGTNVNAVVDFRFAGFLPTRYFPRLSTFDRMLNPVQRNWRVTTDTYVEHLDIAAINPADGQPYFIAHVDNTAAAGGDGTIERPFNTLPATVPGADIILVNRGTTSLGAPLVGSITLEDNQRLLGEGKAHMARLFAQYGSSTINDVFVLPGTANTGNYPFLSSPGNIITLADNNEVAGFNLLGAGGDAIRNTAAGSNNFLLQCLEITDNTGRGINLQNATGNGIIRGVNLASGSTNHPNPGGLGNNLGGGIHVDTGAAGLNLTMSNVAMNSDPQGTQPFGIRLRADNGDLATTMTNVQANGNGAGGGIILEEVQQDLSATLRTVTANDNLGTGIQVSGNGGSILLDASVLTRRLNANNNGGDNLNITLVNGTVFQGDINGGRFNGSTGGSGVVYRHGGGTGTLNLTDIQATGNAVDGVATFGSAGNVANVNILNSALTGNLEDAIHNELIGASGLTLTVDTVNGSGSGRHGIFNTINGASQLLTTVRDSTFDANGVDGINSTVLGGSDATYNLFTTTFNNNRNDGFQFAASDLGTTLNVTAGQVQLNNNGTGGAGNGIIGNLAAQATSVFDFTDSSVSNNATNGMFVTAVGLSSFQGTFDNTPFDGNGVASGNDGIRLDLNNAAPSSLTLTGTTTVNSNGNDGIDLRLNAGSDFVGTFTDTVIRDNGQFAGTDGAAVRTTVSGLGTTGNLTFTRATLTNVAPNTTQDVGFDFTASARGQLTASFTDSVLSNNTINAIDGSVAGAGTVATVNLNNTAANNSGAAGANLVVTTAGRLNVNATNGTSFSNSGADGFTVQSTGASSVANLEFNTVTLNNNGTAGAGDGFNALANTGGDLNVCFEDSQLGGNANLGIDVSVSGANSVARFGVENTTVGSNATGLTGNADGGLLANVTNNGTLLYRSIGSTYNENGTGLPGGAGVSVTATGNGPANTATALLLFSGDTIDSNDGDGMFFNAQNGATLTATIDVTNSTNNGDFGIDFNATGAGTTANLLMNGTNDLSGNTSGPIDLNFGAGLNQVVLNLSGTFDNNAAGDGLNITLTNVNTAVVSLQGVTANDNADNGIFVRFDTVTNGSLLVDGFNSISRNGLDAIHVEFDTVTTGALEISNTGAIDDNLGDGIDISLVGSNLVNGFTVPGASVAQLTLTASDALNDCLPVRVDVALNAASGLLPANAFTIDNNRIDNSGGRGLNIVAQGTTIQADGSFITNNQIENSQNGDGVRLAFDTVSADGLVIDSNAINNNSGNGINFELNNSPLDRLQITNNAGASGAALSFSTTLNQEHWTTSNLTPGLLINQIILDISGTPFVFTTTGGTFPAEFEHIFGGPETGLTTANGVPIDLAFGSINPGVIQPGDTVITMDFTDFDSADFGVHVDAVSVDAMGVQSAGDDLAGATITAIFSNGQSLVGNFVNGTNLQTFSQAAFTAGLSGNGLDGIRFSQTNSSLTNMVIDNNNIATNGTAGTGHGISFETVVNSDITAATISNNDITGNPGDGFRMITPNTAGAPIDLTFTDNTIDTSTGNGINIQVDNAEQLNINLNSDTTGNQITSNGDMGVRLEATGAASINLVAGGPGAAPNLIDQNVDAGIGINMAGTGTLNLNVSNTTISGTRNGADANFAGQGLAIRLADTVTMNNAIIGDAANANTIFSGNASHGLHVVANDTSVIDALTVQNVQSLNNTGDGFNFTRNGTANITNTLITTNTIQGNNGDGIDISSQFFPNTDSYSLVDNQVSTNNGNGLVILAQADAQIDTLLDGNTFTNNGQDGARLLTVLVSPGDAANINSNVGTWINNTFSNNGRLNGSAGAGLEISAVHNINIGTLAAGNRFINNAGDGIEVNNTGTENGTLNIVNATITGNNTEGSADGRAGIDLNLSGTNIITVSNSNISNNLGDGIEYDHNGDSSSLTLTDNTINFNRRDGIEIVEGTNGAVFMSGTGAGTNVVQGNTFRGIDIIKTGGQSGTVSIDNTSILGNGQEGVNVILTSSVAQAVGANRDALSSTALIATGAVGSTPHLNFTLTDSTINNNGQVAGNIGGSGLNMRVGTTRGGQGFNVAGGFASAANGGVNATVTGNTFSGNFGADVLFESFASTANPATTGGAWSDQNTNPRDFPSDTFSPAGFQSDPIARLDLVFNNNTGDELDATRPGAFYNNDESVFKSRTAGQDNGTDAGAPNNDDNGPFGSGTRQRNAQRLAARDVNIGGTQLPPNLGSLSAPNFLFSGLGQSTFRADLSGGGNVFGTITNNFLFDNVPYTDFTDAFGVPNTAPNGGPFGIDNMPWGWTTLP